MNNIVRGRRRTSKISKYEKKNLSCTGRSGYNVLFAWRQRLELRKRNGRGDEIHQWLVIKIGVILKTQQRSTYLRRERELTVTCE